MATNINQNLYMFTVYLLRNQFRASHFTNEHGTRFSVYEFKEHGQNGTLYMNTAGTFTDSVQMNKSYLLLSLLRTVGLSGFVPCI